MSDEADLLERILAWAGTHDRAWAWYTGEPLPAFGGLTARQLVQEGRADTVRAWLDRIRSGA